MADMSALLSGTGDPYEVIANLLGISVGAAILILFIISVWALVWKGLALWKSARKGSKVWFVVLLIINTFGILEILYIFVFSKISSGKKEKPKENSTEKPDSRKKKNASKK